MTVKKGFRESLKVFVPKALLVIYRDLKWSRLHLKELLIDQPYNSNLPLCRIEQTNEVNFSDALKIMRDDYDFPFYIRNNTSDAIVYKSVIDNMEYNFIPLQEPKVIVDAGANNGLVAIYFAKKYPNAKIISIEPEENNFNLLKLNTKNYPNIIALQAALWDKIGEIELLETGLGDWGFMTGDGSNYDIISTPKIQKKYTVKTVTVESLLNDYNLGLIDILKIDIEGAEKEVFQNHALWINNVRSIIVELHDRKKPGCEEAFWKIAKRFDEVGQSGEDFYLSKNGYIKMKKSSASHNT